LHRAAARVALQSEDESASRNWIERGLAQSAAAGETRMTLGLLQEKAWLLHATTGAEREDTLERLGNYAARHSATEALAHHQLQTLDVVPGRRPVVQLAVMVGLFQRIEPNELWALVPAMQPALALIHEHGWEDVVDHLRRRVLAEESPFRFAQFPDYISQS